MALSKHTSPPVLRARGAKERPAPELAVELVFGPLAAALTAALAPLRVPPPALVAASVAAGLLAAAAIAAGELVAGAALLQLKTVLDNADGRLARATGRVTLLGRYLDTEADFAVNAAVLAAVGAAAGAPVLALAAFAALTLTLSVDFNLAALHREARGLEAPRPRPRGGRLEQALERAYAVLFAPQDRAVRAFVGRRLARLLRGAPPERRAAAALAYHDTATLAVLANLGLSTQLAVLGLCLAAGAPRLYLWLAVGALALLPLLQARRELRARRALRPGATALRAG
ncbi:MAG TPA: CDP-alcohol phosphatidyltransferase family protein [Gaiellaceae bacterium]|nr:CDP-alcohol phosphatidyltransferase family protein [Gaiellaceae bacterium]